MISNQDSQENSGIRNVSTKVPTWVADLLNIICKARDTDIYGLLQLVIQFIIETAKVSGPVPPQMQTLIHMLKMDADWNRAFRFSNPTATMDIAQCILVLQQHDSKGPHQGFGLVMIDKPFLPGQTPKMTTCVDDIFERVAEVSMVGLYKELRMAGVALGSESVRETLTMMCDAQLLESLRQMDVEELPKMGEFHDFGKIIEYGKKTKSKHHRTPDSIANQQRIVFSDHDREVADYEAKDWEGEHRQTEEPPINLADEVVKAIGDKPFGVEP